MQDCYLALAFIPLLLEDIGWSICVHITYNQETVVYLCGSVLVTFWSVS